MNFSPYSTQEAWFDAMHRAGGLANSLMNCSYGNAIGMQNSIKCDYTAELRGPLTDDVMQRLAERNAARLEQLRRKK